MYTVNSGYKFLMKQHRKRGRRRQEGASSSYTASDSELAQMWNTLWSLNIKHKIKIFIWKCIQGALPVKATVNRRTGVGDPICKMCGSAQETVEHLLLNCPHTENIWKASPIQWDGAKEQQGDFKRWWLRISEARHRTEGMEHIGLTANILWQVWKERNKREFENATFDPPFKSIRKAHSEWLEQQQIEYKEKGESTDETVPRQDAQNQNYGNEGEVLMEVTTSTKQGQLFVGIGVTVQLFASNTMIGWALKDISSGNKILDEALALKLVLCKAVQRKWSNLKLRFCNKELWRQLKYQSPANSKMATVLEDISQLQRLFCMCSFVLDREENMIVSKTPSVDTLSIIVDEERQLPQSL
nr:uncharacterized protein LOC113720151 [Coffea arabica]XP_027101109.1 uncharacterized protein LOC113720465 [Coffea arabica]